MGNFKNHRMKKNHHKKCILKHRSGKTKRNILTCHSHKHSEDFLLLTFKGICGLKQNIILGHFGKSCVYLGIDIKVGNVVAVLHLEAHWRNIDLLDTSKHDRTFQLENHLKLLLNLKHPLLSQYKGWQYISSSEKISVNIVAEYCGEISLAVFTKKTSQHILPYELVRTYTHEILQAIEYLHLNSVAHRNLTVSNIFLDQKGKLKIVGYGLTNRVEDLFDNVYFNAIDQREDLYCLGLLVLSLLIGKPQLERNIVFPKNLPHIVIDFLHICLEKNKFPHLSTKDLLAHNFVCELFPKTHTFRSRSDKQKNSLENFSNQSVENKFKDGGHLSSDASQRQSRLHAEFEIMKVLGKGGFGDVYKVKNKIDGGIYAIKKIILNPKSKKFNVKMLREVKLLSQLKHEHVVRYYCSWIEVAHVSVNSNSPSCYNSLKDSYSHNSVRTKASLLSNFDLFRDVENLLPEDEPIEWLVSFDSLEVETIGKYYADNDKEFDNQESSIFKKEKLFNGIALKTSNETSQATDLSSTTELEMTQILFIQMECCNERTLRNTIDEGLCNNKDRIWRLFREIIEGLAHIHEKDIIHRDLKPVNIFLDSLDHVKIGDFGLARTDIVCKDNEVHDKVIQDLDSSLSDGCTGENSLTGAIGTVYYVSPELMAHSSRLCYGQKVDIYSLGIIFFEMCYRCLSTEHERGKILNSLRLPTIVFPKDFDINENAVQAKIIRWLLAHDPKLRPTCKELLSSSLLKLNESFFSALHCPMYTSQCQMLTAIFDQKTLEEQDRNYDFATYENMITWPTALLYQQLKSVITHIFTTHGAIHIPLPLFMPKSNIYNEDIDMQLVKLMNSKGGVISLPLNQRVSFARFIGRKNICSMKRFAIEKVYREKKNQDVYPTELTECAFDIISSSDSLIPDSEVLIVVQEIVNKYPTLQARKLCVKMNHMLLLKAILLYCGISEDAHTRVLIALATNRVSANRATVLEKNCDVKLSEDMMTKLNSYFDTEGSLHKVTTSLIDLTLSPNKVGFLTKVGLEDIKNIIDNATYMGLELQIIVSLGFIYKPNLYSGVIYQVLCDKIKNGKSDAIAAGGQYDKLIESFKVPAPNNAVSIQSHGVGISVFLEQLAVVVAEDEQIQRLAPCDFLVCSLSNTDMTKEKLSLVKKMWTAGFKSDILLEKAQDITEVINKCLYKGVSHVVVLIENNPITIQIHSLDQEHIVTRTMIIDEFMAYIQQKQIDSSVCPLEPPWHEIYSMDTSWTDI